VKTILTIFCVIVVLFAGGCALTLSLFPSGDFAYLYLLLFGIVALNLLVLAAIFGVGNMPAWPLYLLAAVDFILAIAGSVMSVGISPNTAYLSIFNILAIVGAGLKGFLTVQVARNMKKPS
jgi:hypothetical protein